MTSFDDRKKSFEQKFAHDAEMQFRVEARRNKLLGFWVAELLGMKADAAADYARAVVAADLEEAGDEDVFRKIWGDLKDSSAGVSEGQVREKMSSLRAEAKVQLMDETGR